MRSLKTHIAIVVELGWPWTESAEPYHLCLKWVGHVVSANKDSSCQHGRSVRDCSTPWPLYMLEAGTQSWDQNSLASDKVTKVLGVVNGTPNFMITKMVVKKVDLYEDALAEAATLR